MMEKLVITVGTISIILLLLSIFVSVARRDRRSVLWELLLLILLVCIYIIYAEIMIK